MGFVVKRGDKYSARLVAPEALRPILVQNEFKKSLGTPNKTEAELRAAPLILHWKKLIEDAKTDGVIAKAKALRRALDNSPNSDLIDEDGFWESTKTGIIEDAIEDIILGGRDINTIDNKEDKAKAKTFFDIASGQVTTLEDCVDGWLLSIEHLKARAIKQMKRDVNDFLKEERIQLPTRESVAAWIRRNNDISPKSIKRKLGSLGSFWDYLMA
jgi:hypothetical protein